MIKTLINTVTYEGNSMKVILTINMDKFELVSNTIANL